MRYELHQHRFGHDIVKSNPELNELWQEFIGVIDSISDQQIREEFLNPPEFHSVKSKRNGKPSKRKRNRMSISAALNNLIEDGLISKGWIDQSKIFQGANYNSERWLLDFSKRVQHPFGEITGFAVEVAFNHGEAIAWNLMKPQLASDALLVKTETEIGFGVGIYVCATKQLKKEGAFDGAVGEFEKVKRYLEPMASKLTCPLIIVGLKELDTFYVEKKFDSVTRKNSGKIVPKPS
jgi:hypothetical protein